MSDELKIVYVDIKDLAPWEKNPKTHNLDYLSKSVDAFSFRQPITV